MDIYFGSDRTVCAQGQPGLEHLAHGRWHVGTDWCRACALGMAQSSTRKRVGVGELKINVAMSSIQIQPGHLISFDPKNRFLIRLFHYYVGNLNYRCMGKHFGEAELKNACPFTLNN